jgi:hypothetical protein
MRKYLRHLHPSYPFCHVTWSRHGSLATTTVEVELLYLGTCGAEPGTCRSYKQRKKRFYVETEMHAPIVTFDHPKNVKSGNFANCTYGRFVDQDRWGHVHT